MVCDVLRGPRPRPHRLFVGPPQGPPVGRPALDLAFDDDSRKSAGSHLTAWVIPRTTSTLEVSMSKSPLAITKEKFGDKAKLIAAVEALATDELWLKRNRKEEGLEHVSNAKLLRLHATFSAVKEQFGSREKLVSAILELENRTKDAGYQTRLTAYPVPRLLDLYKSTKKRQGGKAPAAAAPKAAEKKAAPAPKAAEKKAAAAPKAAKKKAEKS
jgi:hypothetical protein